MPTLYRKRVVSYRYVLADEIRHLADALHLFQMLLGMVRVNHLVLYSDIVATKHFDRFTPGMIE
jgi:hypothetical protein